MRKKDEEPWETKGQEKQHSVGTDSQRIKIMELLDIDFDINLFIRRKDSVTMLETMNKIKRKC